MTRTLETLRSELDEAQARAAHHQLKRRYNLAKLWRERARALRKAIVRRTPATKARPPPARVLPFDN